MKEKLAAAAQNLRSELRWTGMEDAANAMQAHKLSQHRYFLLRDLTFLKDREPLLMKVRLTNLIIPQSYVMP